MISSGQQSLPVPTIPQLRTAAWKSPVYKTIDYNKHHITYTNFQSFLPFALNSSVFI